MHIPYNIPSLIFSPHSLSLLVVSSAQPLFPSLCLIAHFPYPIDIHIYISSTLPSIDQPTTVATTLIPIEDRKQVIEWSQL
ncbi:MAG: hypothetical protein BYD32DRAFT_5882 [Podila humilis]|nr:MAG: hypothetical protein BYD32DRAFT_5882 [Podila humilis]